MAFRLHEYRVKTSGLVDSRVLLDHLLSQLWQQTYSHDELYTDIKSAEGKGADVVLELLDIIEDQK